MRVRLTRKFADLIDGIDLSRRQVGEVITLPAREARILMAEGWATQDSRPADSRDVHPTHAPLEMAGDRSRRRGRRDK